MARKLPPAIEEEEPPLFFDWTNDAGDDALGKLLAPISPSVFLSRYWGRRSIHIPGHKDKFYGFFDGDSFWRALQAIEAQGERSIALIRAHFDESIRPKKAASAYVRVTAKEARRALAKGATLCINVISEGDTRLKRFVSRIRAQLQYPGMIRFNAYWSPDKKGLSMHFDARVTCSLQIEGSKTWSFTREPVVDWPRANADLYDDGTAWYHDRLIGHESWETPRPSDKESFDRVTLEPGDVLILPAGVWHTAEASGSSLALNLAFDPLSPLELVTEVLGPKLRLDPRWRAFPPSLANGSGGGPQAAAFLEGRLDELRRALEDLGRPDQALADWWRSNVGAPFPDKKDRSKRKRAR